MDYWIGLGSNIGQGGAHIRQALSLLRSHPEIELLRSSGQYVSRPWGIRDQADFTNAAALLRSSLQPLELLGRLQALEKAVGGKPPGPRWGPRVLDLDLLLAEDLILHLERLVVPHPRMHRRAFVLAPLAELAPDLQIPARGVVQRLLRRLPDQGVRVA
jgi:2-amino-4-hydroxy-6-hydroxymethyldihydropteridine diphosphokinase